MTDRRLIEAAFPLKQASLDSVHEKNVRHGHISTLHIWPARRPLAAARAALIAALLPDPGTPEARRRLLERIGGRIVETIERKRTGGRIVERKKEATEGGILHWGRENDPDIDYFRREIRAAHGGRAPRVLDPFAGGGAIPLEAMRLGCRATAIDINPVAWFILKCTLDYPRRLAGETRPLPAFARADRGFMESFLKARGFEGARLRAMLERLGHGGGAAQIEALPAGDPTLEADLAWHVRAWGRRVLAEARKALAPRYPTYAEYRPLDPGAEFTPRPLRLLETGADGAPRRDLPNAEFDGAYLADPRNPRWIAKPTVAYLWARTVACGNCRATIPLLKTRWLCKTDNKRVFLTMEEERGGVAFGVEADVPRNGGNAAQSRAHDGTIGAGTMSRAGATCPCCGAVTPMADIRLEGRAGRLGAVLTAAVVDGPKGKEYRRPEKEELRAAEVSREEVEALYAEIPFGLPEEPTPRQGIGASRAFSVENYGFDLWSKLFTDRQLLTLATFVRELRRVVGEIDNYPDEWRKALAAYLCCMLSKLAGRGSAFCFWINNGEKPGQTFARFALPMVWDYCEVDPLSDTPGGFAAMAEWVAEYLDHAAFAVDGAPSVEVHARSVIGAQSGEFDAIVTDPPYYDAIPYSDLMDFFHIWLRRALHGLSPEIDAAFAEPLGPKWNPKTNDGELIDDASRFGGDKARSKAAYEDGMARAFQSCHAALKPDGRLVVVFANKAPDAWETLAAALIRAGFVVDASWPIQTERQNRLRSQGSAALSSSVWLVCRKRAAAARPGWDNRVLAEMRENIVRRLRDFWDAGIRGPDFVWAATGPGAGGVRQVPRRQEGGRARRGDDGVGVPARGPPHGGRFRRRPRACAGRRRRGRRGPRRRDRLLPAPPPRFRHGRGAGGRMHPLCAVVQPVRFRPRRAVRPARPARQGARRRGGGLRVRRRRRRRGPAQGLEPARRARAGRRGSRRAAGAADRPRPQGDAVVARRRPGEGRRLSRIRRSVARRAVPPRVAGPGRAGRRRLRRARHPRIAEQPPRRPPGPPPPAPVRHTLRRGGVTGASPVAKRARSGYRSGGRGVSMEAWSMAQSTARKVGGEAVGALERRAAARGDFAERAAALRRRLRRPVDSSETIRADRDRDRLARSTPAPR